MKTTVEIPDVLFPKAKAVAAERGVPLKDLFTEAVRDHLQKSTGNSLKSPLGPPWMSAFGGLGKLKKETRRINEIVEREFEGIEG